MYYYDICRNYLAKMLGKQQWHNTGGKIDTRGIQKYVQKPTKVIAT